MNVYVINFKPKLLKNHKQVNRINLLDQKCNINIPRHKIASEIERERRIR